MTLDADAQEILLKLAREAIGHGLAHAKAPRVAAADYSEPLKASACSFVTLRIGEVLRGCVGSLQAHRPLVVDVAQHAYGAAFSDKRFEPLQQTEFDTLHIHVSILSELEAVSFESDRDLLASLSPGTHGLLIEAANRRATFLPTVWSTFPDGRDFLAALKKKAGMDVALTGYSAWRYTTQNFEDPAAEASVTELSSL